jgi:hypothetical protein
MLSCVACEPTSPTIPTQQIPGTIHVEGDSVTFQTYYGTGVPAFFTTGEFVPGASADYSPNGYAANERVPAMVAQGKVETLVWALGLNEIFRDPNHEWATKDQGVWYDLLFHEVPEETCIVMVKPWVLPIGNDVRPLHSMNAIRLWMDDFNAARDNVVVVDWRPILEANPQYSPKDGVHLEPGSGAAEARDAMYREGIARCGS